MSAILALSVIYLAIALQMMGSMHMDKIERPVYKGLRWPKYFWEYIES